MNRFTISGVNEELVRPMHCFLDALMSENVIPSTVKRIALNIRSKDMNSRFQPIEIQLERASSQAPWQLRFIATFDVMVSGTPQKELSLYFNFARCWFYHPETKRCNLEQPEVQTLLASWLKAITHTLTAQPAISINITSIR